MEDYKVYVHIDPEGKRYYGATKMDIKKRWMSGYGYPHNAKFCEAIEKYGWSNIEHIIVVKRLTKDEAFWLEEELIKAYDTTNPEKGYNISTGGKGGANGVKRSEETRKKIGEAKVGKNNPNARPVICLTTGRVFYTASEGADYYGIKKTTYVTRCCKGERKSAGKYNGQKLVWRYLYLETL